MLAMSMTVSEVVQNRSGEFTQHMGRTRLMKRRDSGLEVSGG